MEWALWSVLIDSRTERGFGQLNFVGMHPPLDAAHSDQLKKLEYFLA